MNEKESRIAQQIIFGNIQGQIGEISLADFKALYKQIQLISEKEGVQTPEAEVLLLSDRALVKFESAPRYVIHVDEKRPLKEHDFEILIRSMFYGNKHPIPLRGFVWTEIKKNGIWLFLIFVGFLLLLSYDSTGSRLENISQMLVEANALFVGLFVLFTITQNREFFASKELIAQGITHKMMQNDFYMTGLSILSLVLSFVAVSLIGTPYDVVILTKWSFEVTTARLVGVVALIFLIDCLLSVTQYYLKAMRSAVEAKMYKDLMGHSK